MNTKRKLTLFSLFLAGSLMWSSCDSGSTKTEESKAEMKDKVEKNVDQDKKRDNIKKIFYSIPSPIEMAQMIQDNGSTFSESFLNPIENVKKYTTAKSQALNLGVYGADVSYASMFEQNQVSMNYLNSIRNLTNELGMSSVLDTSVFERVDRNKQNKDSLMTIVSEAYWTFNGFLKEERREDIAALVVAGGWVEALHLALSHCSDNKDALATRIAEQKYTLENLKKMIAQDAGDSEKVKSILEDLNSLSEVFDEIEITKTKGDNPVVNGVVELNSITTVNISPETLASMRTKVSELRQNYIQ